MSNVSARSCRRRSATIDTEYRISRNKILFLICSCLTKIKFKNIRTNGNMVLTFGFRGLNYWISSQTINLLFILSFHEKLYYHIDMWFYVTLVKVFVMWIHLHCTGTLVGSGRPEISSSRGAVFVRDRTHLSHSFFRTFRSDAEGKIRSTDWYIQKVSTKVWIFLVLNENLK